MKIKKIMSAKRQELTDELNVKRTTLKNHQARLSGGKLSTGQPITKLEDELFAYNREVSILKIKHDFFVPVNPTYEFERHPLFISEQKVKLSENIIQMEQVIEKLNEQKNRITKEIPELKKRITELEIELKLPLTVFA